MSRVKRNAKIMHLQNRMCLVLIVFYVNIVECMSNECGRLSHRSLVVILGQAYNPRYMSIEQPGIFHEDSSGQKRSSNDLPFYADDDVVSVGDYPAWEADHFNFFQKKVDESLVKDKNRYKRSGYVEKMASRAEMFKSRPWECTSRVHWIDLGVDYFPRYVRSMECVSKKCWYGHFNCKPKSFTIKVLRKRGGSCIKVSEKLIMIASDTLQLDYTELWVWEEVAINFCCECVMIF